ncbi:MAG: caspase family protein [Pseudomonadota bacterium]|nr:caspase family protein [Pseudomonadota bacterium]
MKRFRNTDGYNGTQEMVAQYVESRQVAHQAEAAEKTAGAPDSLLAARSLVSSDKVAGEAPSAELLESFGIKVLAGKGPEFRGDSGENPEGAWNDPTADQVRFGEEIKQKILADIPQSAAYFHNFTKHGKFNFPPYVADFAVDDAYRYELAGRNVWLTQVFIIASSNGATNASYMKLFFDGMKADFPDTEFDNEATDTRTSCLGSLAYCKVNVAAFDDRYLVIWSAESRGLVVFDGQAGQFVLKKFDLPRGDLLHEISLTGDRNHLLQLNSDGTFFVHRIAGGEIVLEGRVVDDEVVVWTPDMRFDATAEGAHFVNLRFPGQPGQYTFQQFDSRLRVAGLADKVLSGSYEPQLVEVGVPPRLDGTLDVRDERIVGTVTPESLGDLRSVRVYQDGVLTDEILALFSGEAVEIDVERLAGARWVSLVAVDEEGLVSLPVGRDLGPDGDVLAQVRLLAVGIDQYDDDRVTDLSLAKSDAVALDRNLQSLSGKTMELASHTVLSDHAATAEAVLAAARDLVARSKPGEMAVFFFAGHGVKGEDGRYYMATSATDPDNISGTALSWDALSAVLANSRARMTVFLDSCHSGAAGTDFFATNDEAAAGILKNIPSGLTVFSASKGRELSEEHPSLGGGVFTTALTRVIAGERAQHDLNGNGMIEVSELYVGVKRQVVEQTQSRQTPWLARNQMIGDFALF